MNRVDDVGNILESLRTYLTDLQDTGVDELPFAVSAQVSTEERNILLGLIPIPSQAEGAAETLDDIRSDLGDCHRCALGDKRTNLVFGVGNPKARIVFVGEAPGRDEDLQGEPFVGEAGGILTRLITRMGMTRDDVYICNVLKCRPPQNRDPLANEIEACSSFMLRQVNAIGPEVIVALGTFAAQQLLQSKAPISKLRGNFHDYNGIPLMPTFHPSYLLRNKQDTKLFWLVWDDMVQVLNKLNLPVPDLKRKGQ